MWPKSSILAAIRSMQTRKERREEKRKKNVLAEQLLSCHDNNWFCPKKNLIPKINVWLLKRRNRRGLVFARAFSVGCRATDNQYFNLTPLGFPTPPTTAGRTSNTFRYLRHLVFALELSKFSSFFLLSIIFGACRMCLPSFAVSKCADDEFCHGLHSIIACVPARFNRNTGRPIHWSISFVTQWYNVFNINLSNVYRTCVYLVWWACVHYHGHVAAQASLTSTMTESTYTRWTMFLQANTVGEWKTKPVSRASGFFVRCLINDRRVLIGEMRSARNDGAVCN